METPSEASEPVVGIADLHSHLGAHLAVGPAYSPGPDAPVPSRPTFRHRLDQQMFREELVRSGVVLYVNAAYESPIRMGFASREAVARTIDSQLRFVEEFVASDPDRFAIAKTPREAREAIAAGKIVFVHAIEGATKLIESAEDAQRWADRGVALVTPIHLADSPLGGATHTDTLGWVLNIPGAMRDALYPRRQHGLTPDGSEAITGLVDAGIVVDVWHMSSDAKNDTLAMLEERNIPPVSTHGGVRGVRDEEHTLTDEQVRRIYALGGLVGIAGNPQGQGPREHDASLRDYCRRSIDDFALNYSYTVELVDEPVAWGSDFNGGVIHARPKYGPRGCRSRRSDGAPLDEFDREGLVHVGAMPAFVEHLSRDDNADTTALYGSAERFLTIWERARAGAGVVDQP